MFSSMLTFTRGYLTSCLSLPPPLLPPDDFRVNEVAKNAPMDRNDKVWVSSILKTGYPNRPSTALQFV